MIISKKELLIDIMKLEGDCVCNTERIRALETRIKKLEARICSCNKATCFKDPKNGKKLEKAIKDVTKPKRGRGRPRKNA